MNGGHSRSISSSSYSCTRTLSTKYSANKFIFGTTKHSDRVFYKSNNHLIESDGCRFWEWADVLARHGKSGGEETECEELDNMAMRLDIVNLSERMKKVEARLNAIVHLMYVGAVVLLYVMFARNKVW